MSGTDTSKPKVLCVDDEQFILSSLGRLLRTEFEVLTADSGRAALEIIRDNLDIAVAVVDQRMPEMSGVELLEKMHANYSNIVKIVLTGYTDMGALIDSINKGEVFRYIHKPWDAEILKTAIRNGVQRHSDNVKNRKLQESLSETEAKLRKVIEEMQRMRSQQV